MRLSAVVTLPSPTENRGVLSRSGHAPLTGKIPSSSTAFRLSVISLQSTLTVSGSMHSLVANSTPSHQSLPYPLPNSELGQNVETPTPSPSGFGQKRQARFLLSKT